jgi:hypothetical protein
MTFKEQISAERFLGDSVLFFDLGSDHLVCSLQVRAPSSQKDRILSEMNPMLSHPEGCSVRCVHGAQVNTLTALVINWL